MIYDNNEITAITYSGYSIVRAYSCGGELVFGNEPTPPAHDYKFMAEYGGGYNYSVPCNSSSTLTRSETHLPPYTYDSMSSVTIGDCVTTIGYNAFNSFYRLVSAYIPPTVANIGEKAFCSCDALTNVSIPSGVTSVGKNAFSETNIRSIVIPNSLTSLSDGVFDSCYNLTAVTIPNTVTNIGAQCFEDCRGLPNLIIPESVTYIGNSAFNQCFRLLSITCLAVVPPTLGSGVFNFTNDCVIYVPQASLSAYQSAWSEYASRLQAIP